MSQAAAPLSAAVLDALVKQALDLGFSNRDIRSALQRMDPTAFASAEEREAAGNLYGCDEVEIDGDAMVSHADGGFWVGAWVWVPHFKSDPDDRRRA